MYKTEEEFLKNYNSDKFEKLSVTTDIVLLSISDLEQANYRKTSKKYMSILLVKRADYPFKDKWCLPGGFLDINEDLDECPKRILERETNLKNIFLEQLYTFGSVDRDPRMRILSTAYISLIDKKEIKEELASKASWFNLTYFEENNIVDIILDNGEEVIKVKVEKVLKEETTDRYNFKIVENNSLAFDHALVILSGIERLKNKAKYTDIVFNMMPTYFALGELQQVYEVILNKKLLDPAFRRIIADKVVKTTKLRTGKGHRPSVLFTYKGK